MLLLLQNAGCYCGAETRGHGGAAERDAVASMEVGRGYGSLQVARLRHGEEDGGGCCVSSATRYGTLWLRFI